MCVGQSSSPSKMCVAYTTVAPRVSVSFWSHRMRSWRTITSRHVVTSSNKRMSKGRTRPSNSCTRRRCPSLTRCMRHSGLTPSSLTSSSLRSGYCDWSFSIMPPTLISAWRGHPYPAKATVLIPHCVSRNARVRLSFRSRKASVPMTLTRSPLVKCLPAKTLSSVLLPEPFAPSNRQREPGLSCMQKFLSTRCSSSPGSDEG
mmetsp:Transcript_8888/g.26182  ORF Transcript_8888/g.26182 Transcript_8888/m.26182 type:complete len:202 (+) Transcript_8888:724-1329(+)